MQKRHDSSDDSFKDMSFVQSSPKKKILVVDDDAGIRDIFKIIFENAGYEIELNEDGSCILCNEYQRPDIFLIDKQLPGTDGLDLCRYLKMEPATKSIPVIIVSASPGIGIAAKNAGADGYIEKPFELNYLLQFVDRFLDPGEVLHKV